MLFFFIFVAVTETCLLCTQCAALASCFHGSTQPTEFVGFEHVFQPTATAVAGKAFKKLPFFSLFLVATALNG